MGGGENVAYIGSVSLVLSQPLRVGGGAVKEASHKWVYVNSGRGGCCFAQVDIM
jgi:hypothetical protein